MFKILPHHHTGRLRPHEHTSSLPLMFLLMVVGLVLTFYSVSYAQSPGPEAGSIGLTGVVPGKPPTTAATITTPFNGQRFTTTPITVAGTCPKGTLVEVFKNDIFAGSTFCKDDETYSIEIDLLIGRNDLVARVYDPLNQEGPVSNTVTVFYDVVPLQSPGLSSLDFGGTQLVLNTDAVFRGVFPDKELFIPIDIIGGTPPYAINVQWGDANNKVVPRNDNTTFNVGHTYRKPGVFQITIQGTDAVGRVAFLTVPALVNGQTDPEALAATATDDSFWGRLKAILAITWPIYTSATAIVVSFWLGEMREKRILREKGLLVFPQA